MAAALLAWGVAVVVGGDGGDGSWIRSVALVALAAVATVVLADARRLYRARVCSIRAVEIQRLGQVALALSAGTLLVCSRAGVDLPLPSVLVGGLLTFAVANTFRGGYRSWLTTGRRHGRFQRPVVVVGSNEEGRDLLRLTVDHPELGFGVVGVIGDRAHVDRWPAPAAFLGPLSRTEELVAESGATGVFIAASALSPQELNQVTRDLLRAGVHVHLSSGLRGFAAHRLRPQSLAYEPLLYLEPEHLARWQLVAKRALDLVLGTVALLLSLPFVVVAAAAIKLGDGGPVIFRQTRIGRNGRPFTMLKLRTMVPDAEARYGELAGTLRGRTGPLVKLHDDPRITRVGSLLRATSVDELPQLVNVLRGSMSLVGPRPNLLVEAEHLDPAFLAHKGRVRPGMTGLWQVEARDDPSFDAYRRLDLFYLENWSISLDVAILLATAQRVLSRALRILVVGRRRGQPPAGLLQRPVLP